MPGTGPRARRYSVQPGTLEMIHLGALAAADQVAAAVAHEAVVLMHELQLLGAARARVADVRVLRHRTGIRGQQGSSGVTSGHRGSSGVKGPPEARVVRVVKVVVRDAAVSVSLTRMQKSCSRP